jgi:hypothetical protein
VRARLTTGRAQPVLDVVDAVPPAPGPGTVVLVVVVVVLPVPRNVVLVVVVEADEPRVVGVDELGAVEGGVVVVVGRTVDGVVVVVGGAVVVVVVVATTAPRQMPGTMQVPPLVDPVPPGAAAELAGGYMSHRAPKPRNSTTISSVERRIGSRRCTGTDMKPTRALCFSSGGSGAGGGGALKPLGMGLGTVGLPAGSSSEGSVMRRPGRRSTGR